MNMARIRKGKGEQRKTNKIKAKLISWMYPSVGQILIARSSVASEGKCATTLFALWAMTSRESNLFDICEPSGMASGVY